MSAPSILAQQLARTALEVAETEPDAIKGLVVGASIILTNRFGSEAAAAMMLEMAIEARLAFSTRGMVDEPTRH